MSSGRYEYNKIMKKIKKLFIATGVMSLCGILAGGIIIMKRNYGKQVVRLEQQVENNCRTIYVAGCHIASGTVIQKNMLEQKKAFTDLATSYFLQDGDIGKMSAVDIEKGSYMLHSMVLEEDIDASLREEEFGMLHLNSNLAENDFVDVRILYPTGENYTVLSKVRLRNLSLEKNDCFFWLKEEEILMMHSAIVDTYIHEGAKLYTAKYVKPSAQKASTVNYDPSAQVQELIRNNPNIVEVASKKLSVARRESMEKRIQQYLEQHPEGTENKTKNTEAFGGRNAEVQDVQ